MVVVVMYRGGAAFVTEPSSLNRCLWWVLMAKIVVGRSGTEMLTIEAALTPALSVGGSPGSVTPTEKKSRGTPPGSGRKQRLADVGYTNNNNIGGGGVGEDMIRRRFEMRERIRGEIEKERIREEIIAEEMALRRVLEAEVRNDLMMDRHMAMRRAGGGFGAPFMSLQALSQKDVFEQKFLQPRLIGTEDKRVMSVDDKFGRGDGLCGVKGVSVKPIQVLADSARIKAVSEENSKEVIVLFHDLL
ncbi:hypothetical protein M8C21_007178 [Ambrosia artemisiifolia]|uniref:Uncharacterized protein n=1 Tax=Ambrosia artemisiifolia TaxID=4212 RepID=A0AAD5C1E8_AMBAR|nr:hypothetical protein M8C21_007178 [Ambrosia artemisiifolia]